MRSHGETVYKADNHCYSVFVKTVLVFVANPIDFKLGITENDSF